MYFNGDLSAIEQVNEFMCRKKRLPRKNKREIYIQKSFIELIFGFSMNFYRLFIGSVYYRYQDIILKRVGYRHIMIWKPGDKERGQ